MFALITKLTSPRIDLSSLSLYPSRSPVLLCFLCFAAVGARGAAQDGELARTLPPPELEKKVVAAALLLDNRERCREVTSRLSDFLSADHSDPTEQRYLVKDYLEREGAGELSVAIHAVETATGLTSRCDCTSEEERVALWDMSTALRNYCEVSDKALTFGRESFLRRLEKAENSLDEARFRLLRYVPVNAAVRRQVADAYREELLAVRRRALSVGAPEAPRPISEEEYRRKQEVFARVQAARQEEESQRRRQEAERKAERETRRIEAVRRQEEGKPPAISKADEVMARMRAKEMKDWHKLYLASIADVKAQLGRYLAAKKAGEDRRKVCFTLAGRCQGLLKERLIFESPDPKINAHLDKAIRRLESMAKACLRGDLEQADGFEASATAELGNTGSAMKPYGLKL